MKMGKKEIQNINKTFFFINNKSLGKIYAFDFPHKFYTQYNFLWDYISTDLINLYKQ